MSNLFDTNLVVAAAPLDPAFNGTLQEYADHVVRRLTIKSTVGFYTVIVSDTKPLSNQGFLLLGGTKPYAWDENTASYEPVDISDSLGAPVSGKHIFTVENGVIDWTAAADVFTWLNFTVANIPPGAAGTLIYSNGAASAWGAPSVALPDASVPVGKLQATGADNGKVATVVAGVVQYAAPASSLTFGETAEYTLPTKGTSVDIARPTDAKLLRVVLVCKTNNAGRVVGEEVEISSVMEEAGSGARMVAFSVETAISGTAWRVARMKDWSTASGTEVVDLAGGSPVEITDGNWKLKAYYLV